MPGPTPPSDLPIIRLDPPRKSTRERYGSLFYLAVAGLVVLVLLIGRFAVGVWNLRTVWSDIYVANDLRRTDAERIAAADHLARDPRVTERQLWDLALVRSLPSLARYRIAEALTPDVILADPAGYARTVARSEGWPNWLRLLLFRPIAYAADDGLSIPAEALASLAQGDDPILVLWASYTLAVAVDEPDAIGRLESEASGAGPRRELAQWLLDARQAEEPQRSRILDRATLWIRGQHPEAVPIWDGWEERGGRLIRQPASNLPGSPSTPTGASPRNQSEPAEDLD